MCEIVFGRKQKGVLTDEDIGRLAEAAYDTSPSNRDGWGVFNDKSRYVRSGGQMQYKHVADIVEKFKGSKFLVFHTRLATHGIKTKEGAHPYSKDGFLMCHNGVVNGEAIKTTRALDTGQSDSYYLLEHIMAQKGKSVPEKIREAIKTVTGYASVFLSKGTDLWYFRVGYSAKFTFRYFDKQKLLVGATHGYRLNDFSQGALGFFLGGDYFEKEPSLGDVYKITDGAITKVCYVSLKTYTAPTVYPKTAGYLANRADPVDGRNWDKDDDWYDRFQWDEKAHEYIPRRYEDAAPVNLKVVDKTAVDLTGTSSDEPLDVAEEYEFILASVEGCREGGEIDFGTYKEQERALMRKYGAKDGWRCPECHLLFTDELAEVVSTKVEASSGKIMAVCPVCSQDAKYYSFRAVSEIFKGGK